MQYRVVHNGEDRKSVKVALNHLFFKEINRHLLRYRLSVVVVPSLVEFARSRCGAYVTLL
jgi:hypothetical protein